MNLSTWGDAFGAPNGIGRLRIPGDLLPPAIKPAASQVLQGEAGARPAGSPERWEETEHQGFPGIWKCTAEGGHAGPGGGVRDLRGVPRGR